MALPAAGERKPPVKKGKSKSRRLAVTWCYREEDSNEVEGMHLTEVKSTNIQSAVTALLRQLNDGIERGTAEFLRKSDLVVVEVRILERGEQIDER